MSFSLPNSLCLQRDVRTALAELETAAGAGSAPLAPLAVQIASANQALYKEQGVVGLARELKQLLKSAPTFDLLVPIEPHDTFLAELAGWFRQEIHPQALLTISVRRSIGGGMIVRGKNRLFDFSLRPKLLAARAKLPEVLARV